VCTCFSAPGCFGVYFFYYTGNPAHNNLSVKGDFLCFYICTELNVLTFHLAGNDYLNMSRDCLIIMKF